MSKIVLKVNDKAYGGWEAMHVGKSILQIAGEFGFATTNVFPYKPSQWDIRMGDECTVEVDGQTLITGHVEEMHIAYDKETHTIQVSGRDVTGDLVDCCFVEKPNDWHNKSILELIKTFCDPFHIDVDYDPGLESELAVEIPHVKVDQGETVLEMISRVCMHRAILPVSYGNGKLTLTRAGTERANDRLELGVNILSGLFDQSNMDRFSRYIVIGDDVVTIEKMWSTAKSSGEATDAELEAKGLYRPLMIISERTVNIKECEERAQWEASVRAGQSRKIQYTVQGWTQSNGEVWPLNSLVRIKDDSLGIDGTRLISALEFNVDNAGGTTTKLILVPKDTFKLMEVPVKEKALHPWG
jgi:prophage tail gpP-like protein